MDNILEERLKMTLERYEQLSLACVSLAEKLIHESRKNLIDSIIKSDDLSKGSVG